MKFTKELLKLSISYYLVTLGLLYLTFTSKGGNGLVAYLGMFIFSGVSLLIITTLAVKNNKKWLNKEYGQTSKLLLLSYLIVPLIVFFLLQI